MALPFCGGLIFILYPGVPAEEDGVPIDAPPSLVGFPLPLGLWLALAEAA